jgi:hypothetical protein
MDNKIKQPTLTDLEKISKILTDFISQTKDADSGLRAKRGANISEIANIASSNHILQNLC